ncbi:DUF1566 domain-containing protein [Pseudoalteromonas phenolica]|uniref:Lcl domain-containing protein n=1 Tax=Pseudoalteromonas phenolica TaxID=161398 RepID=UPI00384FA50A
MMLKRLLLSLIFFAVCLLTSIIFEQQPILLKDAKYSKVDHEGNELAAWQGPWACVYDKTQKLLWEVKRDDESIHDGYWSYSWFNNQIGEKNSGDCYFEPDRCDTQDLIRKANQHGLCQVTGWRLPTKQEVEAILQPQDKPQQAMLATDYFRHIKAGDYWTQDAEQPLTGHYRHLEKGAIAVDFYQGRFHTLPYRNAAFVMLVTSELPNSIKEANAQ